MRATKTVTKDFKKKLPRNCGVYLFKNKKRKIIYVGRAANLKTRISSYFPSTNSRQSWDQRPIEQLINEVAAVSFEKTSNLLEAAVLEANLIKTHMPKYNVKDKDNRSFVYLFFDTKSDFPKPVIVRGRNLGKYQIEKGTILGPYQSQHVLKNILQVARRVYPYSTCQPVDKSANSQGKPCFHNQIGLCPGVCTGEIDSKNYKKEVRKLILFLKSKHPETKKKRINDISLMPSSIHNRVHARVYASRIEGYDISHFQKGTAYGAMVVFENGNAKKSDYRLFKIKDAKKNDDIGALKEVLKRRLKHSEWRYPELVIIDGGRAQVNMAIRILKKTFVNIPVVGISKAGKHAQSASTNDKLIFQTGLKKPLREILTTQKRLFQQVRNEAHRFSLKHVRKSQTKLK